jgi:hypothetical protein
MASSSRNLPISRAEEQLCPRHPGEQVDVQRVHDES